MMGYGWGMGVGGWIAMTIFWVALLALIIWGVSRLLPTADRRSDSSMPGSDTPEQILDRRYAAGEIDLDTYQQMLTTMSSARSGRR